MQLIRQATLHEADSESKDDTLSFTIPFGPLGYLVCIVHIPPEGKDSSLVYVRWGNRIYGKGKD